MVSLTFAFLMRNDITFFYETLLENNGLHGMRVFALSLVLIAFPAYALENVVATVAPIHSLVAGVMDGVGTPSLLVPPGASPHSFSLRPSQATDLQDASIVFRISRNLELFLEKPLETLGAKAEIVSLIEARGLTLLNFRQTGDGGHAHTGEHHAHDRDPHIWLDPANAQVLVGAIATALSNADRRNTATYRRNAARLQARLKALENEMAKALDPLRDTPFITFHDGFQYLEFRFSLKSAGFIAISPDIPAGAARITQLRQMIESGEIRCVFSEPQFNDRAIAALIEGTDARHAVLDPVGSTFEPGPELYFEMMAGNLVSLRDCMEE